MEFFDLQEIMKRKLYINEPDPRGRMIIMITYMNSLPLVPKKYLESSIFGALLMGFNILNDVKVNFEKTEFFSKWICTLYEGDEWDKYLEYTRLVRNKVVEENYPPEIKVFSETYWLSKLNILSVELSDKTIIDLIVRWLCLIVGICLDLGIDIYKLVSDRIEIIS